MAPPYCARQAIASSHLGEGWMAIEVPRKNGNHQVDRYYYSPSRKFDFRSQAEVSRFKMCLEATNGDEDAAWAEFHNRKRKASASLVSTPQRSAAARSSSRKISPNTDANTNASHDDTKKKSKSTSTSSVDDTSSAPQATPRRSPRTSPKSNSNSDSIAKVTSSTGPPDVTEELPLPVTKFYSDQYYEVDKILDRRVRNYRRKSSAQDEMVIEYLISWKRCDDPPMWLVAENLDNNSLAFAWSMYPVRNDPEQQDAEDIQDDFFNPENDPLLIIDNDSTDDDDCAYMSKRQDDNILDGSVMEHDVEECHEDDDDDDDDDPEMKELTSKIAQSDFNAPGTAEYVLNRQTYRVGQSYYDPNALSKSIILAISIIMPRDQQAECHQYIRVEDTFAAPSGMEDRYVQTKEKRIVHLSELRNVCKNFKVAPFKYEADMNTGNRFAYYYDGGEVVSHWPKTKPRALELFAGAGGMCIGLKAAGFDVKWAVESNAQAAATYQANNSRSLQVYEEDVNEFLKNSKNGHAAYPSVNEIDHIHASPPCQGFSQANRNGGVGDQCNNSLTFAFVSAVKHFQPMTASFENVTGLLKDDRKHYLQSVVESLLRMKYQVRCAVLTASKYGDAQNRKRVFLFASRSGILLPAIPAATHGPGLLPLATTKSAIHMLENNAVSGKGSGIVSINEIVVHNHHFSPVKPKQDEHILAEDKPARTILAKSRPNVHYNGQRFLTVRECACLQSFPAEYQFFGCMDSTYRQVGNAVPVKMATAVSRSLAAVHGLP